MDDGGMFAVKNGTVKINWEAIVWRRRSAWGDDADAIIEYLKAMELKPSSLPYAAAGCNAPMIQTFTNTEIALNVFP